MSRWLLCLFSYNRPGLLRNAIRSVDAFLPWIENKIIIDDNSTDPEVKMVGTSAKGWRYITSLFDNRHRQYGAFYRNMEFALTTALEERYDYLFFLEDDQQLLWDKLDYPLYVDRVFRSAPDAIQIQPLFARRLLNYSHNTEFIKNVDAYRTNRGFNTTAIWNLERVRAHNGRIFCQYGDDLPRNSAFWLSRGLRVYIQSDPTVAIVPNGRMPREYRDFVIDPLSHEAIARLRWSRPVHRMPYQEHYTAARRVIWHQDGNWNRLYRLARHTIEWEGLYEESPASVPMIQSWRPSTIPPEISHLQWKPSTWQPRHRIIERAAELARFNPLDYLAYLKLNSKLKKEREMLEL